MPHATCLVRITGGERGRAGGSAAVAVEREHLLHDFISQTFDTEHALYTHIHLHSVAFQMRRGSPARHLLVCLVALAELAEVATAPSVQRSTVGNGSGMKATARDEADALAA